MWNRRVFLKGGALALMSFGWGGTPLFLTRAAHAQGGSGRRKVLVTVFQRGAMDGLMAVQPLADPSLAKLRPALLMPRQGEGSLLPLDGRFGLHPSLAPLSRLFAEKQLAILHGVGSPDTTRSHFDAQDYMESGTPGRKGSASGWLNRAAGMLGHEATPFQAVAVTGALPKSLYGSQPALAISSLEEFHLKSGGAADQSLEALYQDATQKALKRRGTEAFAAMDILSEKRYADYKPTGGANYPNSPLGKSLRQIAFLIKIDVGLEIAFAESNGWDTHRGQGQGRGGAFAQRAADLSKSIAAFWTDLGSYRSDVVLMTMTEFGRTVAQNGSGGTDHGRASCLFVLGEEVQGGTVRGQVGSLQRDALEDGRDLPVTTDFRAVFAGVAGQHLGIPGNAGLFPGWQGQNLALLS